MADYDYITSTGVIVPDTADTLETVRDEYRSALGDDLDVSAETPQGVLITAEAESRDATARNNATLANQINPNIAGGVFLDAIWSLMGGARFTATPSLLRNVTLGGVPGTPIPAGSNARVGSLGAGFELISAVTLDGSGSGVGTFQCTELGPVPVAIGALSNIISPVLGWETVTNPSAAELGQSEESDGAARRRRRLTMGLQGVSLPEAVTGIINTLDGVRSSVFRENVTNATVTIEGVDLVAHSVYLCVDGGTDEDIALALLRKKSGGAGWNGTTTVSTVEANSGQSYDVKFSRPDTVTIYVRATVTTTGPYSDVAGAVRSAIMSYVEGGQPDEPGLGVGVDVSAFELAGAVNRDAAPIFVTNMELSTDGVTYGTITVPITIAQKASLTEGSIAVVVT